MFSKKDTNVLKGSCILIIMMHHIFWNQYANGWNQVVFLPDITSYMTSIGYAFNHVFLAMTGYGFANGCEKRGVIRNLKNREISILSTFIPVYFCGFIACMIIRGGYP